MVEKKTPKTVTPPGRVYLPREVRKNMGVDIGDKVEFIRIPGTPYYLIRKAEENDKNRSDEKPASD